MSEENVELVRSLQPTGIDMVELVGEGEAPGQDAPSIMPPAAAFTDDFVVLFVAPALGQERQYSGVEGLVEAWRDWLEPWASYELEAEDFIDAGDDVVVFVRVGARTARDGVRVEHSPAAIWSCRGGKVTAIRFYLDRDAALEAAGLPERDVTPP
jgi:ketosteroid isomerase-like protein